MITWKDYKQTKNHLSKNISTLLSSFAGKFIITALFRCMEYSCVWISVFIWGSRRPFTRSFDVFYKVLCFSLWLAFINVVTRTRTSRSSKLWKICFQNKQSLWPKINDRRRIMQINSNLDANFCNQSRFSAFSSLIRSSVQLMWKDVVFCTTRYW